MNKVTDLSKIDPKNILIIRLSSIGDTLISAPIAKALKEKYPNAHISWAVDTNNASIVRANPYVDRVISIPVTPDFFKRLKKIGIVQMSRELKRAVREIKELNYDLSIDCQGLYKSSRVASIAHATVRIGGDNCREGAHRVMTHIAPIAPYRRVCSKNMDLLKLLGIYENGKPIVVPDEKSAQGCAEFLAENGIKEKGFASFCYAASVPQKDVRNKCWGELSNKIFEKYGIPSVLFGGPERKENGEEMAKEYPHILSAAGHFPLMTSIAIAQKGLFAVGVDTGVTWAVFGANVPLVALYGSTQVFVQDEEDAEYIAHSCPHAPCRRRPKCNNEYTCMAAITADEIMEKIERLEPRFTEEPIGE